MVNISQLRDEVLAAVENHAIENYRTLVVLVGPPGSGKSTVAEKLKESLNQYYNEYYTSLGEKFATCKENDINLSRILDSIEDIADDDYNQMCNNPGQLFVENIEDYKYKPVKHRNLDGSYTVIGRGGLSNAITVCKSTPKEDGAIAIAEILPMDGFHISRKGLDSYSNPEMAHKRRGSPPTFDSNNFLQLCKLIVDTCNIKPNITNSNSKDYLEILSSTFNPSVPTIKVPGFDHSLKDPTSNQYEIDYQTRIVIMEGLYLLHNEENWAKIHEVLHKTDALVMYRIDIEEDKIQRRVAERHLKSGLVDNLEQGIKKFQANDLLNARNIKARSIDDKAIRIIRND